MTAPRLRRVTTWWAAAAIVALAACNRSKIVDPPIPNANTAPSPVVIDAAGSPSTAPAAEFSSTVEALPVEADDSRLVSEPPDRPPTPQRPPRPRVPGHDPASRARLLALTSRGPLLVQLTLIVDGQPFQEPLRDRVDEALSMIDSDGDGVHTWAELVAHPFFRYGGLGNNPINTVAEERELIKTYDVNKNGRVDREELPRLLTRNAGGSQPFRLTSSNYYRYRNRSDSPVRLLLDQDQNGRLDLSELEQAPARLSRLDVDEDEILQQAELTSTANPIPPLSRYLSSQPESAIAITPNHRWDLLAYTVSQMYALGGELSASNFDIDPSFFTALDQNLDGSLDALEWRHLLDVQPHLDVEMNFFVRADGQTASNLRLRRASNLPILEIADRWPNRLVLKLPNLSLTFFMHDAAVSARFQAQRTLGMYDVDRKGYLELEELPEDGLRTVFSEIDQDSNQQLHLNELEAFHARQQLAFNSQLRGRAGEADDALLIWLDQDHDGRLTSRELASSRERIELLDVNGDGEVDLDEIPDAYMIGVVRGDPLMDDQSFVAGMQRALSTSRSDAPRWFANMDINKDGDVSWREFLGSRERFDLLDRNGDGFLDVHEATLE